jgi:hypothetical protein
MNEKWTMMLTSFIQFSFITQWKKMVFCNWPCNLVFELQWSLTTHHISTLWVFSNKLHESQSCNSAYIRCNSLQLNCNYAETTHFQLLCNSTTTIAMVTLVIFIHPLKLNMWHYEIFGLIFLKYWFSSSIMIVDGSILWHVA